LFGLSLGLVAAGAVGATVIWATNEEWHPWVGAIALSGAALLVAAVTLALRDVLQGVWKISRTQLRQHGKVVATESALRTLQEESAVRDDILLNRLVKLDTRLGEMEAHQAEQESKLARIEKGQRDEQARSVELAANVGRVARREDSQRKQTVELAANVDRIARRQDSQRTQTAELAAALRRLEKVEAEKTRPLLRDIEREQAKGYRQIESLVSLLTSLDLRSPLPHMRKTWAIDPDSAAFLIRTVFERSPRSVLELGSGVSTVLVASALRSIGSGHLRSIEHDRRFLEQTERLLQAEGLAGTVELLEAGLTEVEIGDTTWRWYSPEGLAGLDNVDLVIVDGPPASTQEGARYPAVPLLAPVLRDGALVFLDDAGREDEQRIVERWLTEFPLKALDVPKLERGAALLEWKS
jgi:predicted O-methyltransferase YrrM